MIGGNGRICGPYPYSYTLQVHWIEREEMGAVLLLLNILIRFLAILRSRGGGNNAGKGGGSLNRHEDKVRSADTRKRASSQTMCWSIVMHNLSACFLDFRTTERFSIDNFERSQPRCTSMLCPSSTAAVGHWPLIKSWKWCVIPAYH